MRVRVSLSLPTLENDVAEIITQEQLDTLDAWIAALESGKYAKGTYTLKKLNGDQICYCCLGVLAELKEVPNKMIGNGITAHTFNFKEQPQANAIPLKTFRKWTGLNEFGGPDDMSLLIKINDSTKNFSVVIERLKGMRDERFKELQRNSNQVQDS